jgi:peptide/nickel transport system substrate-binding protein
MKKTIIWMMISGLMVLILILASCGKTETTGGVEEDEGDDKVVITETETTTGPAGGDEEVVTRSSDEPQYGGTLNLATGMSITQWDPTRIITGTVPGLYLNSLWEGDWARGPAGGYGTGETDWGFTNNDIFDLKMGIVAESWEWSVNAETQMGTIVYQIRPGVHWALDTDKEASRLVNGREVTADDVVFSLTRATTWNLAFVASINSELRNIPIEKTGPREVTATVPLDAFYTAITRLGDAIFIVPPEVVEKYGDLSDWRNQVGTGPFYISDWVNDSFATAIKNPDFWMTDPVGPGQGNQLPYVDRVKTMVVVDASTRLAALRTGKVDHLVPLTYDQSNEIRVSAPDMIEIQSPHWQGRGMPLFMRTDTPPFDNVLVRRAMNMAIDRDEINQGLYEGKGDPFPLPFAYTKEYDPLYLKPTDPDYPPILNEIYSYNPEKAKQLLADAGYPDGFKTTMLIVASEADYNSILVEYWKAIGIEVEFQIVEPGEKGNMSMGWTHPALVADTTGPVAVFMVGNTYAGHRYNLSLITDDQVITDHLAKVRTYAYTDLTQAMKEYREMTKHVLEQAYHVPDVAGPVSLFYWPWIKNYSGEITVGYDDMTWPQYVWVDQDLKKSMGY